MFAGAPGKHRNSHTPQTTAWRRSRHSEAVLLCALQVLQWVFAGAPGHPALREICDHIARHATTVFSNNTNRDTLERTGPGVWTDVILKHALAHPPSKASRPCCPSMLPEPAVPSLQSAKRRDARQLQAPKLAVLAHLVLVCPGKT